MRVVRLLWLPYLAAVGWLTLRPSLGLTQVPQWSAAMIHAAARIGLRLTHSSLEAWANLVMFVPFGVFGWLTLPAMFGRLRLPRGRWSRVSLVTMAGLLLTLAIETAQKFIPGRYSTLQDVLLNTAGALVGATVAALVLPTEKVTA